MKNLVKPKRLKKGDKIGFLAISGEIADENKLKFAKKHFENKGFRVKFSDTCFFHHFSMAGTVKQRLNALHSFFDDSSIDAIFCARGGYGTLQLVNLIDYKLIHDNKKIFIGFSDITNLNLMFLKKSFLTSFYGPMPYVDFFSNKFDLETEHCMLEVLSGKKFTFEANKENSKNFGINKSVQGILLGGNLSTVASLCGVDFLHNEEFIFFVEDWNDPAYKIDRMFTQILNIPKFRRNLKALVVGDFLNIENKEYFEHILSTIGEQLHIPVISGFNISHGERKITLPMGVKCELDSKNAKLEILETYLT